MDKEYIFTVIIPVWHSGKRLKRSIESLTKMDFPHDRFELIVAGSADDTGSRDIVHELTENCKFHLKFLACSSSRRAVLLNSACQDSKGIILAFAADDCIFKSSWLSAILEIFSDESNIGVIGGPDDLEPSSSKFAIAVDYCLKSFLGTGGLRGDRKIRTGIYYPKLWNMAVQRQTAFEAARYSAENTPEFFDVSLATHEDVDFAERVSSTGRQNVFSPNVKVGYKRDRTLGLFVRGNFTKARASKSLGVHRLPHTALAAFVLLFLTTAIVSFFSPAVEYYFYFITGTYCLILTITGLKGLLHTRSLAVFLWVPVILASLHFARGTGYLSTLYLNINDSH